MGKDNGSGGQQPSTTTIQQASLPEYAAPYFTDLLSRTASASTRGYTPYPGQRLAGLGGDTQAGFGALRTNAQGSMPGEFGTATGALTGVANAPDLAQQGQFSDLGSFTDPGVASQYMNPYITNVLDAQQDRLTQRFGEDQLRRNSDAVSAGAFSGTRRGIVDAIAQRELSQQRNELDASGMAQAYQSGAGVFDQERAGILANRGLNRDVFAGNQARALDQQAGRVSAASGLLEQGQAGDDMRVARARNLAGIGGIYDERAQAGMDMGYQDFINQRGHERDQLDFYSGILHGVPTTPQQSTQSFAAPPSRTSQLLGLGVGGLSLANAFMGS
jgi:hypothetical protein